MAEVERAYRRSGDVQAPAAAQLRGMIDRTNDMLPAVAALVGRDRPEYVNGFKNLIPRLRHQLAVGGGEEAAGLYGMRVGLSRGECHALAALGVTADNLRDMIVRRRPDIEALLSTPRFFELQQKLADPRVSRRRTGESEQLLFEGLDSTSPF